MRRKTEVYFAPLAFYRGGLHQRSGFHVFSMGRVAKIDGFPSSLRVEYNVNLLCDIMQYYLINWHIYNHSFLTNDLASFCVLLQANQQMDAAAA